MEYHCDRCLYTTSIKYNYLLHLRKKNICFSVNGDNTIDIFYLYNKYNLPIDENNIQPIWKEYRETKNINLITKKGFQCQYCNSTFTRHCSLLRHQNKCLDQNKLLNELEKHKKIVKELTENIDTIVTNKVQEKLVNINTNNINSIDINNNTINNMNQSIVINGFGNEDISYISNDKLKKLALNIPNGIHQLAAYSHFCPEHPENKNIKIEDKNDEMIKIWKDNKWVYRKRNKVLEDLILNKYEILNDKLDEMKFNNELTETKIGLLDIIKDRYVDDDDYFHNIMKNMEIVILNNSDIEPND